MSLKQRALSGLFWTLSEQFSGQIINFIIQIILARILLPFDFGLIAMIMVFIGIGNALSDGGLTSSLIRTVNADNRDLSSVFFFNLFGSITIYLIIFILAPFISIFYNQPQLTLIIRVLSISILIKSFVGVQLTILKKELKFKKIMLMSFPSVLLSGIVGVVLAKRGFGVWSLVWLNLTQSIAMAIQVWLKTNWHPGLIIDRKKLSKHYKFGYKLTLASLLNVIFLNIYNLIIGKWFSAKELGYYNRADTMQGFPLRNLITAVKKVVYPLLSKIQDNDALLRSTYKRMMLYVVFGITPLMILLIIIAKPLIVFLLTEKWLPVVPYFQLLCISSILYPLQEYNLQILDVKGRSDVYLKIEVIKKVLTVIAIILLIPFGIYGLLYAQIILSIIFYFISSYFSGKIIDFSIAGQLRDVYPIFLMASLTGCITWLLNDVIRDAIIIPSVIQIGLVTLLYFALYLALSYTFKIPPLGDLLKITTYFFNSKRKN